MLGVTFGVWSLVDDAGCGGVQDTAAGSHVSSRRQGVASGCNLAGNQALVVEFQNGRDDSSGGVCLSLEVFLESPAVALSCLIGSICPKQAA